MFNLMEVLKYLKLSFTAIVMFVLSPIVKELIPDVVKNYLSSIYQNFYFFPRLAMIIEEGDAKGYAKDQIYEAATTYLRKKVSDSSPKPNCFRCRKTSKQKKPIFHIMMEEEFIDNFRDIILKWKYFQDGMYSYGHRQSAGNYFELSFYKRSEKDVLEFYLPHLLARAEEILKEEKAVKLYSWDFENLDSTSDGWGSIILDHPATFEKLAMDPELKSRLIDDLDRFVRRKEWYKKVGRAWKRGYLLHGPPGTGKSSLIAAMANHLKFDIYSLDISRVESDSYLRQALTTTSNRSIMIIEDIDCALMEKRGEEKDYFVKFTLSGILNVIDGLWSSCGDERIIVFTTNNKKQLERLDPALFRPGRMDMHVYMSYCTMYTFKQLVFTYLDYEGEHHLYGQIEGLLGNLEVTPAEIAEELSRTEDTNVALKGVVEFLEKKKCTIYGFKRLVFGSFDFDGDHKLYGQIKGLLEKFEVTPAEIAVELSRSKELNVALEEVVEFLEKKKELCEYAISV